MIALPEGTATSYARRAYEESAAPVRARIGVPDVAAAWAEGRAMSEADAVSLALTVAERATA